MMFVNVNGRVGMVGKQPSTPILQSLLAESAALPSCLPHTFSIKVTGQEGCIPQIGLGTAGLKGDVCTTAVAAALKSGYRMVDTALLYDNQEAVGKGIRESGVARNNVFVTSKVAFFPPDADESVWMYNANNLKGGEEASIDLCLEQLSLEYVDLLLVHNPCVTIPEYKASSCAHFFELFRHSCNPKAVPQRLPDGTNLRELVFKESIAVCKAQLLGKQNQEYCKEVRKSTWRAMERALKAGKCKMIGVSNYPAEVLEEMLEYAEIMPAVNQLEHHPRFASTGLVSAAERLGCVLTGYGLVHAVKIGQISSKDSEPSAAQLSEVLAGIAKRLGKTEVQVALRWQTQRGVVAIPRSSNPAHMKENLDSLDFELDEGDLSALSKLDQDHPYYWRPNPTRCTVISADAAALVT